MSRLNERALELLADRATQGLIAEEENELKDLLGNSHEWESSGFDLAAAALSLNDLRHIEPLPARLQAKIAEDAWHWLAEQNSTPATDTSPAMPPVAGTNVIPFPARTAPKWQQRAGWYLAAAACLALALTFIWPYLRGAKTTRPAADLYASLHKAGGDVVNLNWTGTGIPESEGVAGDVVWSNSAQKGVMHFRNLKPNDPQRFTYQLWIFDATRDERYPVDGGYFDVPAGQQEVFVPINAKLPVNKLALFALTIEPPGGVVVSKREKIVVVAKNL
jgi:hypothetical protein